MAKSRTIQKAYAELKSRDPETAISLNYIRQLVINGIIPSRKAGSKYLFDLDKLEEYMQTAK